MVNAIENTALEDESEFVDELKPGTKLLHGQYTIDAFLNSGGFGITYLARDSLDRLVVIKECFPGSLCRRSASRVGARSRAHQSEFNSVVKRFVQEARSLAKLEHPNIVGVHQVFEDNDTAYMALDYIDGFDLLESIEGGASQLSPEMVTRVLRKLLSAVEFIHDSNILHRDISPDNILIDKDTGEPLLIDFGAAREEISNVNRVLSALHVVKDGYSPQEFYIQGSKQGPSSDLYALGATFYHIIANEIPPGSQTRLAALAENEKDPYKPLANNAKYNKDYDALFLSALDKALNVFPKDRIQSANEWMELISSEVRELNSNVKSPKNTAKEAGGDEKSGKPKSKKLLRTTATIAIAAGVGFALWQSGAPESDVIQGSIDPDAAITKTISDSNDTDGSEAIRDLASEIALSGPSDASGADAIKGLASEIAASDQLNDNSADSTSLADVVLPEGVTLIRPRSEMDIVSEDNIDSGDVADLGASTTETEASGSLQDPDGLAALEDALQVSTPEVSNDVADNTSALDQAATETSEPVVASVSLPEIEHVFSARLPFSNKHEFSGEIGSPLAIARVGDDAPDWMQVGQRIVEVNSQPIQSFADINEIVSGLFNLAVEDSVEVIFAVEAYSGAATIQKTMVLNVVHDLVMPTGLTFRVQTSADGQTETIVAESKEPDGGLVVGDIVVGFMATGERIGVDISLEDILQREVANGIVNYSMLVLRDGEQWVAPFGLETEN